VAEIAQEPADRLKLEAGLLVEERPRGDAADVALLADGGLQGVGFDPGGVVGPGDLDVGLLGTECGTGGEDQKCGGQASHEATPGRRFGCVPG
jgi:hypothetical protein